MGETNSGGTGGWPSTLNVDTQKLGLWPGGFLRVQGMSSFGQNVNDASGALVSPNMVSLLPEPGGPSTGLMDLTFMQFFQQALRGAPGEDQWTQCGRQCVCP